MNTKKETPKLAKSLNDTLEAFSTKSAKIRFLDSKGYSRGDIARILGVRYQHVRNVLITPIAKS